MLPVSLCFIFEVDMELKYPDQFFKTNIRAYKALIPHVLKCSQVDLTYHKYWGSDTTISHIIMSEIQ